MCDNYIRVESAASLVLAENMTIVHIPSISNLKPAKALFFKTCRQRAENLHLSIPLRSILRYTKASIIADARVIAFTGRGCKSATLPRFKALMYKYHAQDSIRTLRTYLKCKKCLPFFSQGIPLFVAYQTHVFFPLLSDYQDLLPFIRAKVPMPHSFSLLVRIHT